MFDLNEKNVFVTGAASGIGEAIARQMAAVGAFVYVADIDEEKAREVAGSIESEGGGAEAIQLDVASREACDEAARYVAGKDGRLDILVNNAGIGHVGTLVETELDDLERLFDVNVAGVFNLTKAFLSGMIERKYGVVINIASIGGVVAIRDRVAYCTTKFAVVGFTKCVALDHALDGIRANCICPGRVETPFVRSRLDEYPDPEKAHREMSATQAVGRMGKPEEIAAAAVYLASDEAAFVTGTAFEIDGGFAVGK
jgi:NAD(P)-dependent dehydrogenase (short-subunit alcohol dehydrogenase family)